MLADWIAHLSSEHRDRPFDLLHAYYVTRPAFVAVYAGALLGIPSVVSARGNDLDRTVLDPSKAAHTLHALREADAVTANSRDLAAKASALGGRRHVSVIPNGVDTEHFRPLNRDPELVATLALGPAPVIGFVGEARAKKGLSHLLLAFAAVAAETPASLVLVGGVRDEDRPTLDVFRARNPALRVLEVDHVDPEDLPRYYALLDVAVMPSVRDGLPNALLEAMACGCAVVATDAGGMPDVLRSGVNGHMVPVGDVDGLAAGIRALLADADLRSARGIAARETVVADFTPAREVGATLALYRQLVQDPA
jgi:glycosyltransferase involved in cell wall biosynthesis